MAYSPVERELWNHDALEGLGFECKAFFVYLFANPRIRPSGIYRVTDDQLAVDLPLPVATVRVYLEELVARRRIVRDGAWLFLRGYLSRQGKNDYWLSGARKDIQGCTSIPILEAFIAKYPMYSKWVTIPLADHAHAMPMPPSAVKRREDTEKSSNGTPPAASHDPSEDVSVEERRNYLRAQLETIRARGAESSCPHCLGSHGNHIPDCPTQHGKGTCSRCGPVSLPHDFNHQNS